MRIFHSKKIYAQAPFLLLLFMFFFTRIASANPEAYSVFKQGLKLEKSNRVFQAKDAFKIAIILDPGNRGYKEHFAWFLHYHNFSQKAVRVFEQLLDMPGDKGFIYRGLGWNNMITGRLEESISAYRKVFTLPPEGSRLRIIVDAIKEKQAEENRAKIDKLLKTLEKDPENIGVKKELFETYTNVEELKNAIPLGEDIKKQDPNDMVFSLKFARALAWNNEKSRSEAEYRRIFEYSPESAFIGFELGHLLNDDGRLGEAQQILQKSLELYPDAVKTRKELAEVLAKMKFEPDAINTAAGIDGTDHETLDQKLAMARVLHFIGRLKEAKKIYRQVLEDYPYNHDALWGLTETSVYSAEFADAKEAMTRWENGLPDGRLAVQKNLYGSHTAPTAGIRSEYYENSSEFNRYNAGTDLKLFVTPKRALASDTTHPGSGRKDMKMCQGIPSLRKRTA